jgi:ferredoxin
MAYKINKDDCVNCGACEGECEFDAISEQDGVHVIDPSKCQECGKCADACPQSCIDKAA